MNNVKGMTELKINLAKIMVVAEAAAHEAIVSEAEEIATDARSNAPVASGTLRDGISVEPGRVRAEVQSTAWYSHFVENGTTRAPAQPFMGPAAEGARARFQARARAVIGAALGRIG